MLSCPLWPLVRRVCVTAEETGLSLSARTCSKTWYFLWRLITLAHPLPLLALISAETWIRKLAITYLIVCTWWFDFHFDVLGVCFLLTLFFFPSCFFYVQVQVAPSKIFSSLVCMGATLWFEIAYFDSCSCHHPPVLCTIPETSCPNVFLLTGRKSFFHI